MDDLAAVKVLGPNMGGIKIFKGDLGGNPGVSQLGLCIGPTQRFSTLIKLVEQLNPVFICKPEFVHSSFYNFYLVYHKPPFIYDLLTIMRSIHRTQNSVKRGREI